MKLVFLIYSFILYSNPEIRHLPNSVDRPAFYAAMKANNINAVNKQLQVLEKDPASANAYTGALLMIKAGLVKGAFKKLNYFKKGKAKLEAAIQNNHNIEYNLIRLMIQENAPSIANYSGDIENDSKIIRAGFNELPEDLQKIILDYQKVSKSLANTSLVASTK